MGGWGVSFLIYAFNAALAVLGDHFLPAKRSGPVPPEARRRAVRCALGAVSILAAVHVAGWGINRLPVEGSVLRVAAMQPDVEAFEPLVRQAAKAGARVLVWPELALSEPIAEDLLKYRQPGLHQVIGYAGQQPEQGLPENYASLVGPEGSVLARYSKIHLFGSERFVHAPGRELVVADGPAGKGGLAICYDTMFTEIARGLTRKGAQILYVPNFDPNAHRGALHALHAAATVFRAAENGVPLVRSEWRGYSMIIDARGRILGNAAMSSPTVLVADLVVPSRPGTLYTRIGDLFPWACLVLLLGLIVTEMRGERGRREKREEARAEPAAVEPERVGT